MCGHIIAFATLPQKVGMQIKAQAKINPSSPINIVVPKCFKNDFNLYKPKAPFKGHSQTVQTHIKHSIMLCQIRIFTVCFQNGLLMFGGKN